MPERGVAAGDLHPERDEITKMGLGYLMSTAGVLSLASGSHVAELSGTKVSLVFLLAFHFLNSIGFASAFPAGLAPYARRSPPALAATMMGVFHLQFFAASNLAGFLGGYLEKMPGSQFWGMHAAMVGFAVVLLVRPCLGPMGEPRAAPRPTQTRHASRLTSVHRILHEARRARGR